MLSHEELSLLLGGIDLTRTRRQLRALFPATPAKPSSRDAKFLQYAKDPPISTPITRKLRVFAFDPLLGQRPDFLQINETTLEVTWEALEPGPVGEYLEVVDVDPSTGCCFAPVDLNHPFRSGLDGAASLGIKSALSPANGLRSRDEDNRIFRARPRTGGTLGAAIRDL